MLDEYASDHGLSRRHVLSGIAVLGVAGVAFHAPKSSDGHGAELAAVAGTPKPDSGDDGQRHKSRLTLHGQLSNLIVPEDGSPPTTTADLIDDQGNTIGSFWSAALAAGSSVLLFHTFVLPEGMLFGEGSGPLDEATFAVVGGTGSHRGANGQYVARQRPAGAGGDGSAEFVFDLVPGKE